MNAEATLHEWSIGSPRVRWSAIIGGWVVGLVTHMVLMLLGLGVGAWSVDLSDSQPMDGIPLGTGIWTGISMLVSAFVGGFLAARLSGCYRKTDGLYHGTVVWGVNWLIIAWLTTTAMAYMVGGLFNVLGTTMQAMSSGVKGAASAVASRQSGGLSISADELRSQIESVMQATGKQELQPAEVKKDAERLTADAKGGQAPQQVTQAALGELQQKLAALDRDAAVNVLVAKMGMSEPQAEQLVGNTIGMMEPVKEKAQDVKHQSLEAGTTAINRLGTISMWLSALALVTLALAITGGIIGVPTTGPVEAHNTSYGTGMTSGAKSAV